MEKGRKSQGKNIRKKNPLDDTLKQIGEQLRKGSVTRLRDRASMETDAISSGSIKVDEALGVGGYPKGRIVKIHGPEPSGKTTLTLRAITEVQKKGGRAAFIDAENTIDPTYTKDPGVNIDDLILSQSGSGEQALDITGMLIKSGAIGLVVTDSATVPAPQAELDSEVGDASVSLQVRVISKAVWKLSGIMNRSECTAVFINQLREEVGIMFRNPETTSGGRALKFHPSMRLDIRRNEAIKNGTDIIGNKVNVKVVENKVTPLFKAVQTETMYGEGISYAARLSDLCVDYDIVMKSGTWFSYNDRKIGQGKEAAKTLIKSNPALMKKLGVRLRGKTASKKVEVSEERKEEAQVSSFSVNMGTLT